MDSILAWLTMVLATLFPFSQSYSRVELNAENSSFCSCHFLVILKSMGFLLLLTLLQRIGHAVQFIFKNMILKYSQKDVVHFNFRLRRLSNISWRHFKSNQIWSKRAARTAFAGDVAKADSLWYGNETSIQRWWFYIFCLCNSGNLIFPPL